ncbi:GNAT family N-acetyltransferase [Jiulongibacter sediminis]|jgi:GNAT superfamily N-acetyltransferase|uniref:GNAT family N-acetyltransferase n=1 Tax=Jiulongibacter sediminis TaxID=1605367 RepID=UPI0026E9D50B|nr:GNAT family N-acetyltransferase [Jiulongibacter sediminis]
MVRKAEIADIETVRSLFRAYEKGLGLDLCFQGFEEELAALPGKYAEPEGCILLYISEGEVGGVVALKALETEICEMKRLYVKDEFRGQKIGKTLARAVIEEAKRKGYLLMKLDTLARLVPAVDLYRNLGFKETEAYNYNPDETVLYFEKKLN